jgi:molybdopterin-containing oxidoreductase family iron-sulfur binding subunit
MQKKKDENIGSRRNFLKRTIVAGAGAIAGGSLLAGCGEDEKSGVKVKVLTTDGKVVEVDRSDVTPLKEVRKEARQGIPGRKFAMVMDLAKCANARKCVTACQEGHNLPKEHEYMRVYLMQDSEKSAPYWFPKNCFHCDNPLCVSVCPVGATYKRSDGIVLVDSDRCIGCKFCMTGCPYSARIFSWGHHEEHKVDVQYNPEHTVPGQEGTVSKCVFCADRLAENKLPYCVEACPMGVIYFGDINEDAVTNGVETVKFSELIADRAGYRYLENLGTRPNVYYLPPTNRQFPVDRGYDGLEDDIKERYKDTDYVKNKG